MALVTPRGAAPSLSLPRRAAARALQASRRQRPAPPRPPRGRREAGLSGLSLLGAALTAPWAAPDASAATKGGRGAQEAYDANESPLVKSLLERSKQNKEANDAWRLERFYKRDYRMLPDPCDPRVERCKVMPSLPKQLDPMYELEYEK